MFEGNEAVTLRQGLAALHVVVPLAKANEPEVTDAGVVEVIFEVLDTVYAAAAGRATASHAAAAAARTAIARFGVRVMRPEWHRPRPPATVREPLSGFLSRR